MFKRVNIDYDFTKFLNASYNKETSCIVHQVKELKDIHSDYGGFSDSYNKDNTAIKQLWWDSSQVNFVDLGNQLNMQVVTVSSILQPPGNVIPIHRDTFFQIKKRYPNDKRRKVRANIYLENWKMGHIIHYKHNNEWFIDTHWKAGQGLFWDDTILHVGANIGLENKLTLQISGFLHE